MAEAEMRKLFMENRAVPDRSSRRHAALQQQAGVPAAPVIRPAEQYTDVPFPLVDGMSPTVGWLFRPQAKGSPAFVIIRRGGLGKLKVIESFPLTEDGWADAWRSLVSLNPAGAPKLLTALDARQAEAARLDPPDAPALGELRASSLASVSDVAYLGGYVPEPGVFAGGRYDLWFAEDRLVLTTGRQADIVAEVRYAEVEDLEIGGPGLVKTGGGFAGGGLGAAGAVEGMAIAAALNRLTTRTSIKTVLRIQATGCELFLLNTRATPEQLRIDLSRPLGLIRSARATGAAGASARQRSASSASPVEELTRLAALLDKDLLTREEFDLLKAKVLGLPTGSE